MATRWCENSRQGPQIGPASGACPTNSWRYFVAKLKKSARNKPSAGAGAFNRAQGEGSKLFEALVSEGMSIEKHTRKLATGRVDAVRDAMEDRVAGARARATDSWDRLEKVFEDRVQRALNKLGIPGREEVAGLTARIDALTAQIRRNEGKPASRPAAKKAPAAKKSAAKKPAAKKAAARKSLPKAARPVSPRA